MLSWAGGLSHRFATRPDGTDDRMRGSDPGRDPIENCSRSRFVVDGDRDKDVRSTPTHDEQAMDPAGRPELLGKLREGAGSIDQLDGDRRPFDERQADGSQDVPGSLVVLRLDDGVPDRPGAAGGAMDEVHAALGQGPREVGEGTGSVLDLDHELRTHEGGLLGSSIGDRRPIRLEPIVVSRGAATIGT
jgi:hypothetical protein